MSNRIALALIAVASFDLAACAIDVGGSEHSVVREQKRIPLTGMPNVTIRTYDGAVELRSWDRDEILLDIERRASTADAARAIVVRTSEEAGNVRIEAEPPRREQDFFHLGDHSSSVHMVVTVPRRLNADVRSGDGSIRARDLTGRIEIRTGDGAVTLQRVAGEIRINTGDGAVAATEMQGTLSVNTGDGAVDVSGTLEEVTARSGDGGIRIDARPGSRMARAWNISSGDGGVTLRVPADLDATVDAHTGDGGITADGVINTGSSESREHGILRGQIGKGGEVLTVRTGDGAISIVAR